MELLERQGTAQKTSLGDTIRGLRACLRVLEGSAQKASTATGRGEGNFRYVTHRYLESQHFVTYPALDARDYLPRADLPAPPPAHPTLPIRLTARLADLEVSVLTPGGEFDSMQARLRDLSPTRRHRQGRTRLNRPASMSCRGLIPWAGRGGAFRMPQRLQTPRPEAGPRRETNPLSRPLTLGANQTMRRSLSPYTIASGG